ncbi:heme biosynthesis protein HemY [Dyella sp. LX-66]|uniref:heme biosynthesis HemY N-terminal domain-containing protein n=1 Tax=unclassified Dyella TaxID=2634549 RepID=UPI001BE11932|nr:MULTISPECIES: heme biosynthesis HemY N-terminal domain-containing protein [unclassified Dyella]MBT2116359.1 heme biosynthesis protein HemY [Dyella sp. LX-1]MBT2140698.1 heme biosynthesis protein HemY [Dyella sp. LX-66]
MNLWRWILLLVAVAAVAAFGWHWVAADPGYMLVQLRGWQAEMSVVAAVVALLVIWGLLGLAWRLARWPFGALSRRHRRISRQRLGDGLVALMEGRHGDAERDLNRASRLDSLRGPALLASAEAASRRGEHGRALEALAEAGQSSPRAARVLRARVLRRDGKAAEALALLAPEADAGTLSPGGWRELAIAALDTGDFRRAREALEPLQKSGALGSKNYAVLEGQILSASLRAAPDGAALNQLWSQLPKSQRRAPAAIDAYARAASGFGMALAAMDEVESALRREWSPLLIETYGVLGDDSLDARLRRAEGWLDTHPNDPYLLLTLGRMCVRLKLWSKAHAYLERSLALKPTAEVWEALGDAYAGEGDDALAKQCYRNALAFHRGAAVLPLPQDKLRGPRLDTRPVAVEERSEHGVPRLPE